MMERHEIEKAVRKSINIAFNGNLAEEGPYSLPENGTLHGCWFDWGRERIDGQSFSAIEFAVTYYRSLSFFVRLLYWLYY